MRTNLVLNLIYQGIVRREMSTYLLRTLSFYYSRKVAYPNRVHGAMQAHDLMAVGVTIERS